jgi:uncharacterized protein YdhG (YjbR/CyaY superfamily)
MKNMKKSPKSAKPTTITATTPKNVKEYLARVPPSSRGAFLKLRQVVRSAAPPDAIEELSYGILAIRQKKVLVWYGAFAAHCSLFPTASLIAAFAKELKDYPTSKGTIKFPRSKPIPVALVRRMVRARVAEARKARDAKQKAKS